MQISSTTNSENIQNLLGGFAASSKPKATEGAKNEAYQLNISAEAQQAYADSQSQANRLTNPEFANALPSELQNNIDDMQSKLNRILRSNNISTDRQLEFTINDQGKIELVGDYPDKESIEKALNSNSEFVSEAKSILDKVSSEAQAQLNDKRDLRLKEHEEDDEEKKKKQNELERQMNIKTRALNISQQISAASNNFTFNGGTISFTSLNIAQSAVF